MHGTTINAFNEIGDMSYMFYWSVLYIHVCISYNTGRLWKLDNTVWNHWVLLLHMWCMLISQGEYQTIGDKMGKGADTESGNGNV